jgi:hypothetical protein
MQGRGGLHGCYLAETGGGGRLELGGGCGKGAGEGGCSPEKGPARRVSGFNIRAWPVLQCALLLYLNGFVSNLPDSHLAVPHTLVWGE